MIQFQNFPADTRNPGFAAEIDPSRANTGQFRLRTLVVGQVIAGAQPVPSVPVLCPSAAFARTLAGAGSPLALMAARVIARDPNGEIWVLPVPDNGAGQRSTVAAILAGTATAGGTLSTYVCDTLVQTGVPAGTTAAQAAATLAAVANAIADLPVTAAAAGAVVTFTVRVPGPLDLDVRWNHGGGLAGEVFPAGLTATAVLTPGTGAPDLGLAFANCSDIPFASVVLPYADAVTLDAVKAFLNDQTGRWAPVRLLFGHGFAAVRATLGQATTLLAARNDQHMTVLPVSNSPTPSWLIAADMAGSAGLSLRNDPGIPLQRLAMGWRAPPVADRFTYNDRNTLLYDGGSTYEVDDDGTVRISRLVTTYQTNTAGVADNSYLDVETMFQLADEIRFYRADITTVFARKKIVSDGTRFGAANPDIVSPRIIRAHMLALYRQREELGRVQDYDAFKQHLVVEYAGNGRVNILLPVILAGQLRIVAMLVQFTKP